MNTTGFLRLTIIMIIQLLLLGIAPVLAKNWGPAETRSVPSLANRVSIAGPPPTRPVARENRRGVVEWKQVSLRRRLSASTSALAQPLGQRLVLTDTLPPDLEPWPTPDMTRQAEQNNTLSGSPHLASDSIISHTATVTDLARALVTDPTVIVFTDFVTQPNLATSAIINTPLTSFPTHGDSYVALSTGHTGSIPVTNSHASTNWGGGNVRGDTDYDVTLWRIGLSVPAGVNCLELDFQFLSEEYPTFVGSAFNDAFIGELDHTTWTTSGSNISAPDNFIFDAEGNLITVNSVVGLSSANGLGTAFDGGGGGGATPLLSAQTPVTPGPHTLYLSILDQGDQIYDSTVFLDNLNLFAAPDGDCEAGVIEPEKIFLPLMFKNFAQAPDLVVDNVVASGPTINVTIKNIGTAPAVDPFWVDVYLNPHPAPTEVNQHWWQLADEGVVWGVTQAIPVNVTLTLTMGDSYYSGYHSHFNGNVEAKTPVWVQVDSVNLDSSHGGVLELHELNGGAYNNIVYTLSTAAATPNSETVPKNSEPLPLFNDKLPPRKMERSID